MNRMSKEQFDEKLDELSREAALHQSLPYNEAAWQSMEELLDKKEKRRRFIFWWWFTPLIALLISISMYWLNNTNETIEKLNKTTLTSGTTPTTLSKNNNIKTTEEKTISEINKNNKINDNKKELTIVTTEQGQKSEQKKSSIKTVISKKANLEVTTTKNSISKSTSHKSKTNTMLLADTKTTSVQQTNSDESIKASNDYSAKQLKSNIENEQGKSTYVNTIKDSSNTITKAKNIDTAFVKADTAIQKNENTKSNTESNKKKTNTSILNKFELSVNGSADMTTVKFKKADQLSTAYGIGISYTINQKLSITSGLGIAKKIYNADSADYNKTMYLPWYSRLNNIKANCSVIEVPLNVQYILFTKNKSSWIAAAGVSNYFMKSEEYIYEYTQYGVSKTATYSYSNRNNHLLSILNIAIAYRKAINQQLSWQISPYAKIPLTGIGEGKVQLSSLGVQGSIHFRLKK